MPNFNPFFCTVIEKDGMHIVINPDGTNIPCIITTVTTDSIGEVPQCTLTIHCNIAKDYNEAINKYQKK
jgi:hypothetical protein